MATRPCYTFHSSFSYLYYRILSYYMLLSCIFHILSSCIIHILHIHLYVLILSYTLCFRILSVLFLYWFKANTFISYLYFSYYVNFYLVFHISRRSIRLILLLSYHILSYVFIYVFMCFHILYFLYTFLFSLLSVLYVTPPTRHPKWMSSGVTTLRDCDWDSLTFSFSELTPAFIYTISIITKILFTYTLYIPP